MYCTPIDSGLKKKEKKKGDRTLTEKMRFNEGSDSLLEPVISDLWKFFCNQLLCFLDKIKAKI